MQFSKFSSILVDILYTHLLITGTAEYTYPHSRMQASQLSQTAACNYPQQESI